MHQTTLTLFPLPAYSNRPSQISESDLAAQARVVAAQASQNLQTGARGAATSFNRFVEGPSGPEPAHKDFWDEFSALGDDRPGPVRGVGGVGSGGAGGPSGGAGSGGGGSTAAAGARRDAVGTAAMRRTAGAGGGGSGGGKTSSSSLADEGWDDNW